MLIYAPLYFFRVKMSGDSLNLGKRLGWKMVPRASDNPCLWIHAVSVGEVLSLRNLIRQAKESHPEWDIFFSTLTNSGYRVAKEKLSGADHVFFVPLDFSPIVRRFFKAVKPSVLILTESEFWPNLLHTARKSGRPVLLINGRISGRSYRSYGRMKPLIKKVLHNIDYFLVQTDQDKERLEKIGVPAERTEVAGNLKCEVNLPPISSQERQVLRQALGRSPEKKILIAGSTHKGEEKLLLEAFQEARKGQEDLVLILVPRHPERANDVKNLAQKFGLEVKKRTELQPGKSWDVLVLDTIGELSQFYALADLAFVGGSLVPKGGQNLLEPIYYEKPVLFGPHMENFALLAEQFLRCRAAKVVNSKKDLIEAFQMKEEQELIDMGKRAKELLDSQQGATQRTLRVIESLVSRSSSTPDRPSS